MVGPLEGFGLLVLFLWVWRSAETEVIGIIGSSIELQCCYPEEESLNYNRNRILWQIKDRFSCFVAGYFPNENMEVHQCEEFKQRTLLNEPKQGSASLQLSNIRIADEFIYQCIIQKNTNGQFKLIHNESISLKVAANYRKPVITGPVQLGEEIMFMCNSSHGYPEQRLYWINEMDNSTMNITVQFTKELDGSFTVFSTLKMKIASDIKLGCTIEHKQLHQNITTTIELKNSKNSHVIDNKYHRRAAAFSIPIAVLIPFIAWISWKIYKHSLQTTYTGMVFLHVVKKFLMYWKKEELPTIQEWTLKVTNLAEMAKISAYLKDHSDEKYKLEWRRWIDYIQNKYGTKKFQLAYE